MKAVIQRVAHASVKVDEEVVGSCGRGYMILLGVAQGDTETDAELLCKKIAALRIFRDIFRERPRERGRYNPPPLLDIFQDRLRKVPQRSTFLRRERYVPYIRERGPPHPKYG